jgi:hypothetical protein
MRRFAPETLGRRTLSALRKPRKPPDEAKKGLQSKKRLVIPGLTRNPES